LITYKRIIDRSFLLPGESGFIDAFIGNRQYYYAFSARGGIEAFIHFLGLDKNVFTLLPAFSAQGLVLPFHKTKANFLFYKSDENLKPDIEDIKDKILNYDVKAVIIIHYFGFPQDVDELISLCRKQGILVIEDCAQAFLSKDPNGDYLGSKGDMAFFSMTKFLPIPDGSLFVINNNEINIKINFAKPSVLRLIAFITSLLSIKIKSFQVRKINQNSLLLEFFAKAFNSIYYKCICYMKNPQKMTEYSIKRMKYFDMEKFILKRSDHAILLKEQLKLKKENIFREYYTTYILTGYPVLVDDRDALKKRLKKAGIETLSYSRNWFYVDQKDYKSYDLEYYIFQHHILLPVNEHLTETELENMVSIVNNALESQ
jgi:dTDP-4-amino-4,6-dideoxygalactose transaminase